MVDVGSVQVPGAVKQTAWLIIPWHSAYVGAAFSRIAAKFTFRMGLKAIVDDPTCSLLKVKVGFSRGEIPLQTHMAKQVLSF